MANVIDTPNTGSNYNFADKMEPPQLPRSVFNLSHHNSMSIPVGKTGALIPVALLETVPNDSFQFSVNALLRVLPQVVPLYSTQKVFIHAFSARCADLWQGFNTYMTKGYSGNRILKKPTLNEALSAFFSDSEKVVTSDDLLHYLYSIPIGTKYADLVGKVDALPLLMYMKIWRDYFMNKNYYISDRVLLPDDDSEFRLNNNGELICDPNHTLDLCSWRFRDFAPDRFTSAMPSPQRGDAPTLSYSLDFHDSVLNLPVSANVNGSEIWDYGFSFDPVGSSDQSKREVFHSRVNPDLSGSFIHRAQASGYYHGIDYVLPKSVPFSFISELDTSLISRSADLSITLNDFRQLAISQTEMEKMARTDGSYSEFGLTFYGRSSKTAIDYRPTYIGGTYQPFVFTEVIQNSQSTDDSVLGSYAGHGISSRDGNLGHITCDDYGFIMILASIVPDTYYSQGLQRQFTRLFQEEQFMPDRCKLGAQPILNKEVFFTGDVTQDDGLFAYQDVFDEMRYIENSVHGKLADPNAIGFFEYTQSRHFEQLPTYSQSFATMKDNVRVDFLAAPIEVPYTADFSFSIRAVRPLPYRAIPARII